MDRLLLSVFSSACPAEAVTDVTWELQITCNLEHGVHWMGMSGPKARSTAFIEQAITRFD